MIKKIGDAGTTGKKNVYDYSHPIKVSRRARDVIKESVPHVRRDMYEAGVPIMPVTMSAVIEWVVGRYLAERKKREGQD